VAEDRSLAGEIEEIAALIESGVFARLVS
jgi:hypothetical protein